jgi:hypothetical protein
MQQAGYFNSQSVVRAETDGRIGKIAEKDRTSVICVEVPIKHHEDVFILQSVPGHVGISWGGSAIEVGHVRAADP